MFRTFLSALSALVLCAGVSLADEIKGKVKSVDADKNTITVTVGDKDQTIPIAKDAEVFSLGKGKKGQPGPKVAVTDGIKGVKEGTDVTLTTEKKDDKDTVTAIKVEAPAKKKKDKN